VASASVGETNPSQAVGIGARRAALTILTQVREGGPFEAALTRGLGELPEPDRRLAHELAAGVLRHRSILDQRLAPLVSRGWNNVAAELQDILRLGAYQITALERVPTHAAVDTSVALAKASGGTRAAGFVNAVLRRLTRTDPEVAAQPDLADNIAREHSHPPWLVRRWIESFGLEQTEALLRWNNTRPRLVAQPARRDLEELAELWRAAGLVVELAPYEAGLMSRGSRPAELPGYREGQFIIQDPAQALLARYICPFPQATVYDACAAPGGKTITVGRHVERLVAGEVNRLRARRLADNLTRAGSGREYAVVADARHPPVRPLDTVLLDAPCLGTGTIARHPDARWRITREALGRIAQLQTELLAGVAAAVAPGGLLVYSTCSLEPEENRDQVERFLTHHPEFHREEVAFPEALLSPEGDLVILPQLHGMDGAYAARLRRSA
jgi:16S rRNA (cytosine967-C5)-methyltransferase